MERQQKEVCYPIIKEMLEKPAILKDVKTVDLVNELSTRDGVEERIAEPYQDIDIKLNGPAVVLIIID